MARIYPSLQDLEKHQHRFKFIPEEQQILYFLDRTLDDSFEIYYRPFFNGLRPIFVLLRDKGGMLIIDYYPTINTKFHLTPKNKFDHQKFELLDLILSPEEKKAHQRELLTTIHGATIMDASQVEINKKYKKDKYYTIFSLESFFEEELFNYFLEKKHLSHDSIFYNEAYFKEIRRHLKPSLHKLEEGKVLNLNPKQKKLIISEKGDQRIKGIAGTGKTSVLAYRAVNANKRTGSEVLILSFNITIRHYVRQKLENVQEDYVRTDFHISHYHDFFRNQSIQFENRLPELGDWENIDYFEASKDTLHQYATILIDEAQDYKREWIQILKKYFLKEDGEFVIYFDSNQNIYDRRPVATFPIKGRPNELSTTYRLSDKIAKLTKKFYYEFFDTDEVFEFEREENLLDFDEFREGLTYKYFASAEQREEIYNYIKERITESNSSPDDIAIISTSITTVRELEFFFRTVKHEKTTRMFESKEEQEDLTNQHRENSEKYRLALKDLRRGYKLHKFNLVTGSMKFSSLHSFKGWEIHTIFFIISEEDRAMDDLHDTALNEQLIYTGITRARNNLSIINLGSQKYHRFFEKNVK